MHNSVSVMEPEGISPQNRYVGGWIIFKWVFIEMSVREIEWIGLDWINLA
jgi:hypothetical protein